MARKTKGLRFYESVGRRRGAVARVRLYLVGKDKTVLIEKDKQEKVRVKAGEILINYKPFAQIITLPQDKARFQFPLTLTNSLDRFAICILVRGGGKNGQLEAAIHGLSRALSTADVTEFRPLLKKEGLLTRDPRIRERRKVGRGGKARRAKQSPKR